MATGTGDVYGQGRSWRSCARTRLRRCPPPAELPGALPRGPRPPLAAAEVQDLHAGVRRGAAQPRPGMFTTSREIYFATYQALVVPAVTGFVRGVPFRLLRSGDRRRAATAAALRRTRPGARRPGLLRRRGPARAHGRHHSTALNSYDYFGNPVYRYTLRQGIEDGFLAPYRVRRVMLSPDAEGWEPALGCPTPGRGGPKASTPRATSNAVASGPGRAGRAASPGILRRDPTARCIVFCVDTEHADEMRSRPAATRTLT